MLDRHRFTFEFRTFRQNSNGPCTAYSLTAASVFFGTNPGSLLRASICWGWKNGLDCSSGSPPFRRDQWIKPPSTRSLSASGNLFEERPGFSQVRRIEPFAEPIVALG